ncbi:MAG: pantoate--beta-alanine ligase [Pseudomonadota bacterium]
MDVVTTKADLRAARAGLSGPVGFVPTMGFLHAGHMSLVARSRAECTTTLASIFVNPTQFGPNEDLDAYPRDMPRDLAMLEAAGVDLVFTPTPEVMYDRPTDFGVDPGTLGAVLMGALRPGHFRGVATVVTKLFNIVQPDRAYFGEKDFQQLAVIRAMVDALDQSVKIIGCPTVREPDGLAMSSRNARLTPAHRAQAKVLHRAMEAAAHMTGTVEARRDRIRAMLAEAPDGEIESIDICDAATLKPLAGDPTGPAVILLAVRFGEVLLIDQRVF